MLGLGRAAWQSIACLPGREAIDLTMLGGLLPKVAGPCLVIASAGTVNTVPLETAAAFREHGRLRNSLEEDPAGAERVLKDLEELGIPLDEITDRLLIEGVDLFASAFRKLLDAIRARSVEAPAR